MGRGFTTAGQGWGQLVEEQKPRGGAGPWADSPAAQCGRPPDGAAPPTAQGGRAPRRFRYKIRSFWAHSGCCKVFLRAFFCPSSCFGDGEKSKANTSLLPRDLLDHTDSSTLPIFSTVWGDRFCPQLMQRKKS